MTNSTSKTFGERLSAIMEYDDIPEGDRARFLMGKCGLSRYMAKLVLSGKEPRNLRHFKYIASGLDVDMVTSGLFAILLASSHRLFFRMIKFIQPRHYGGIAGGTFSASNASISAK